MAHYIRENRILTSDEDYYELIFKWKIGLFIVAGIFIGLTIHASLPTDWPKILRFILIASAGAAGGGILSHFAREIEALTGWLLRIGILFLIGIGVWNLI